MVAEDGVIESCGISLLVVMKIQAVFGAAHGDLVSAYFALIFELV
jgi:hypothetical protein